ncbi:hydroxyacid dehydrogenase, partial [Enterococcus faecium]|nr:hydroxyacid dehydrogenase [Enterococcus faecium]
MPDYHIAIVNSSSFGRVFPHHLERLKSVGDVHFFTVDQEIPGKELAELLKGFNIIIASVTPFFRRDFFENKDELLLISRHGIGYNNIDLKAAKEHQTIVSIIP